MGYETKLMIVHNHNGNFKGACFERASVDLHKVGSPDYPVGKLIREKQEKEIRKKDEALMDELDRIRLKRDESPKNCMEWHEREYEIIDELKQRYPYAFVRGNEEFRDDYGTPLMLATLKEVYEAIKEHQAHIITERDDKKGYRWFAVALKMLEELINNEQINNDKYKVVLWGH